MGATTTVRDPVDRRALVRRVLEGDPAAERELYDEERIREELLLLQLRLDEGEITEDDYLVEEADIMVRLRAARDYWRQQRPVA